ncbi:MAG: helix-turn-helix transcriptional regulator [Candidatus Eremiobacteraeota bacterium]|nr:helix-turn-helix transcriptional regulator [Candidatus Eremiobacteraeota bacterium]
MRAAISLFFEQGVESTTMQHIAKAAGVSYGLFYHYFRSKEDILGAAAEQLSVLPLIKEFLSHHDRPLQPRLKELVSFYLDLLQEHRETVWLIFSESRKRPSLAARIERLGRESRSSLVDYLAARRQAGEIREDCDLEATARLIWGQLFMRHLWGEADDVPDSFLPVVLKGILPDES